MIRDLSIDPDQQDRFVVDDGGQTYPDHDRGKGAAYV
jgi:hypothetical protein